MRYELPVLDDHDRFWVDILVLVAWLWLALAGGSLLWGLPVVFHILSMLARWRLGPMERKPRETLRLLPWCVCSAVLLGHALTRQASIASIAVSSAMLAFWMGILALLRRLQDGHVELEPTALRIRRVGVNMDVTYSEIATAEPYSAPFSWLTPESLRSTVAVRLRKRTRILHLVPWQPRIYLNIPSPQVPDFLQKLKARMDGA